MSLKTNRYDENWETIVARNVGINEADIAEYEIFAIVLHLFNFFLRRRDTHPVTTLFPYIADSS